jgi:hypothetical protein
LKPNLKLLRDFQNNKEGFATVVAVTIVFVICSSLIWLVGALIVNKVFDGLSPMFAVADPRALITAQTALNMYAVMIVVVDGLLILWCFISAGRVESRETPGGVYF